MEVGFAAMAESSAPLGATMESFLRAASTAACLPLSKTDDARRFIAACRPLRHWLRELRVDFDANPKLKAPPAQS